LLEFVALYGLILMPMGAIIFVDFWLMPKLGLKQNFAEVSGSHFIWAAGLAWAVALVVSLVLPLEIFFKGLPGWFIAVAVYVLISFFEQKKKTVSEV